MFSSKSFRVSGLKFRSLIRFEFILETFSCYNHREKPLQPLPPEKILPSSPFLLQYPQTKKAETITSDHIHAAKEKKNKYLTSFSSAMRGRLNILKRFLGSSDAQ